MTSFESSLKNIFFSFSTLTFQHLQISINIVELKFTYIVQNMFTSTKYSCRKFYLPHHYLCNILRVQNLIELRNNFSITTLTAKIMKISINFMDNHKKKKKWKIVKKFADGNIFIYFMIKKKAFDRAKKIVLKSIFNCSRRAVLTGNITQCWVQFQCSFQWNISKPKRTRVANGWKIPLSYCMKR